MAATDTNTSPGGRARSSNAKEDARADEACGDGRDARDALQADLDQHAEQRGSRNGRHDENRSEDESRSCSKLSTRRRSRVVDR
jgi:hypothetical protein